MAGFNDLGLREPLLMALEEEGIEHPTALQQAAIPVLRREGNLVARAGSGSGKTAAYALGVLDRIEPRAGDDGDEGEDEGGEKAAGPRVLILVPTEEGAEATALALVPYAHAVELTVTAAGPGWGIAPGEADVLAATPQQVLDAVRASGVKLDGVEAMVVDGASDIEGVGGWEALETLFDNVPRTAQRVVLSSAMTPGVQDMVDRRVKRAIRYPTQPALAPAQAAETTGVVGYVPVADREKVDVVARLLGGERGGEAAPVLVCRTDERASQVAEALALRGFLVGEAGDADADVAVVGSAEALQALAGEDGQVPGTVISFDVPADEHALRARHGGEITGFVLVQPRELAHLHDVAARAGLEARPAGVTGEERPGAAELRAFRQEVRRALRDEDLGAVMLVLEPLFEDHTPAEVAAALGALLRRKRATEPAPAPASAAGAAPASTASAAAAGKPAFRPAPSPRRTETGPAPAAFSRLYVGVGERDGVRPGDLVGAIAGETDIPGSSVGKIDIRDTFSIVEVPADLAERVIQAVNGTTIKGRSARVDYDRGADRARAKPGFGGGDRPPRRPREEGAKPFRPREEGARTFRPREEGAKPFRPRDEGAKPFRPREEGARPFRPRDEGAKPSRPRDEGDRPKRPREDGDRPRRPREEGDRPRAPREGGASRGPRGPRPTGDRPGGRPSGPPRGKPGSRPAGPPRKPPTRRPPSDE